MGNVNCKIENGQGEKSWWPWSECKPTSCNTGYKINKDTCVVLSGPCTPNPTVDGAKTYVYDSTGTCVVDTCDTGYSLLNNLCINDAAEKAPAPISVPGWNADVATKFKIFDTYDENPKPPVPSIQACADLTKKRFGDAFTYRDSTETSPGYASTCLGYGYMPQGYTLVGNMQPAPAQNSACVDPTKTFPNCGVVVPGWNSAVLLQYQNFDTFSSTDASHGTVFPTMKSCADEAYARGAAAFTYRTSDSPAPYTNTCIGINAMPTGYTLSGDMIDPTHVLSACVDPTKTFPNCV